MQRVGIGYDIHRLVEGRKLFLGGVGILHAKGLEGHSDGDVVLHAICDAFLGAMGKGDIGEHFPNTDPKYKGISSLKLLSQVGAELIREGYAIGNIDVAIQAEEPKLQSHKAKMKQAIAACLAIDEGLVNIKATTQEGLGAIGEGKGIAAFASVLINKKG